MIGTLRAEGGMNHRLGGVGGGIQRNAICRLNNALTKASQQHDFWISNLEIVLPVLLRIGLKDLGGL